VFRQVALDGSFAMPPRILVLSASVGAGHMRAAQAVELALRQRLPDAEVQNIDVLEITNKAFRRMYGKAYLDLVNKAPYVLGYVYDYLDRPAKPGKMRRSDRLRRAWQWLNLRKVSKFLRAEPWDLAINTHFLPAEIIAALRHDEKLDIPQVTVTTDFETHRLWMNEPCERYFTATQEGALYLHSFGAPSGTTRVTGIPIHPDFAEPKDRAACLQRQGLIGDRPVVLQLAGGFGVGPIARLFEHLLQVRHPLEVVVVSGRNEKVREQLETVIVPERHRVRILGFTNHIDELMAAADLVVSKPGGLTTSEALASGLGMVIVNPIPGQERRNSDYLLEQGAAIKVNNLATLPHKVEALLDAPDRLSAMKANAKRIGRPRAAFDVVDQSLELIGIRPA
jgi:processive 1,2-diacylglycerol beta-glucosyltransferase